MASSLANLGGYSGWSSMLEVSCSIVMSESEVGVTSVGTCVFFMLLHWLLQLKCMISPATFWDVELLVTTVACF